MERISPIARRLDALLAEEVAEDRRSISALRQQLSLMHTQTNSSGSNNNNTDAVSPRRTLKHLEMRYKASQDEVFCLREDLRLREMEVKALKAQKALNDGPSPEVVSSLTKRINSMEDEMRRKDREVDELISALKSADRENNSLRRLLTSQEKILSGIANVNTAVAPNSERTKKSSSPRADSLLRNRCVELEKKLDAATKSEKASRSAAAEQKLLLETERQELMRLVKGSAQPSTVQDRSQSPMARRAQSAEVKQLVREHSQGRSGKGAEEVDAIRERLKSLNGALTKSFSDQKSLRSKNLKLSTKLSDQENEIQRLKNKISVMATSSTLPSAPPPHFRPTLSQPFPTTRRLHNPTRDSQPNTTRGNRSARQEKVQEDYEEEDEAELNDAAVERAVDCVSPLGQNRDDLDDALQLVETILNKFNA